MKTKIFTTKNSPSQLIHNGSECTRWKKEIARVGKYEKPADGIKFEFTKPWLEGRVQTFNRMKANGVRVPVPSFHFDKPGDEERHANDATKNKGWVEDLVLEGDSLYAVVDLYGEGSSLPLTSDVSLHAPPSWRDGKGNDYEWPIRHVALTPDPCLPGLKPWQSLALSSGEYEGIEELTYTPEDAMDYSKIANALGLKLDAGDENPEQIITDAILELKASATIEPEPEPEPEPTPEPEPELKEDAAPVEASPLVLSMAKEMRGLKLDALTSKGVINKATRDGLEKAFCGESLALTLSSGGNDQFDMVCEALNCLPQIIETNEVSGPQTVTLSNAATVDETDKTAEETKARMRKYAGIED